MLSDDIQTVNSLICKSDPSQAELDAWQRIKTAHVELGTTPNMPSKPVCPLCGDNGKVWRMNFAGAHDWYDCECKSGKPIHVG
jgi:hypothetical protein